MLLHQCVSPCVSVGKCCELRLCVVVHVCIGLEEVPQVPMMVGKYLNTIECSKELLLVLLLLYLILICLV